MAYVVCFRSPEASVPALWTSLQEADIQPTPQVSWVPPQPSQHSLLLQALPAPWWDSEGAQSTRRLLLPLGSQLPPQESFSRTLTTSSPHPSSPHPVVLSVTSSEAPRVGKEQVCTSEMQPAAGFSVRGFGLAKQDTWPWPLLFPRLPHFRSMYFTFLK